MADRVTPTLPSRDFAATAAFYAPLGFAVAWDDGGWLILRAGALQLEFFPAPGLDPLASDHGCCLRLDDVDAFYARAVAAGIPEGTRGHPRLHPPRLEPWGGRVGALIDPDGSLLRLIGEPPARAGEG